MQTDNYLAKFLWNKKILTAQFTAATTLSSQ